jgi:hypothetical protein
VTLIVNLVLLNVLPAMLLVVSLVKITSTYTIVLVFLNVLKDIGLILSPDNVTLVTIVVRIVMVVLLTTVMNVTLQNS